MSAIALGTAGEAHASTSPQPVGTVAASEFHCGPNNWVGALVPENPPAGADFDGACAAHDSCYDDGGSTNRKVCDQQFRNRMYSACGAAGAGSMCPRVADVYYDAVRGAGWSFDKGSVANN